jgi:aryl-alcohol dehydrogenase-like predicted oxidoreductase
LALETNTLRTKLGATAAGAAPTFDQTWNQTDAMGTNRHGAGDILGRIMQTRRIGSLEVSLVGLGCNNFGMRCDEERSVAVVRAALDAGINFFDTADIYGRTKSEEFLGRGLAGKRDEVIIATKFAAWRGDDGKGGGASAPWIAEAIDGSLRRLGTEYVDLYQQHIPDDSVPIDETQEALDRLVRQGKVREIGNSNFTGAQIAAAAALSSEKGWARFVSAQNQYSLLERDAQRDVIPAVERNGLALLPYFPLAHGLLTGKYRRGETPPAGTRLSGLPAERAATVLSEQHFDTLDALTGFAESRGRSVLELAFAWLTAQPAIASVIAGATSPVQVAANTAAVAWTLSEEDLAEIDGLLERSG